MIVKRDSYCVVVTRSNTTPIAVSKRSYEFWERVAVSKFANKVTRGSSGVGQFFPIALVLADFQINVILNVGKVSRPKLSPSTTMKFEHIEPYDFVRGIVITLKV